MEQYSGTIKFNLQTFKRQFMSISPNIHNISGHAVRKLACSIIMGDCKVEFMGMGAVCG